MAACIDGNNNSNHHNPNFEPSLVSSSEPSTVNNSNNDLTVDLTTPCDEVHKIEDQMHPHENGIDLNHSISSDNHDKNLNELLDQVAELDEIYSDNQTRLSNMAAMDNYNNSNNMSMDVDDFDDRKTYSSLQLAFKNPVSIVEPDISYEDVITHKGPIIDLAPLKRDTTDEKLPPLPPKRIRKTPSVEALHLRPRAATLSVEQVLKPGQPIPLSHSPTQSQQALNKRPQQITITRSADCLPSNLPSVPPKKRSFLSRIFNRKSKDKSPPRPSSDRKPGKLVGRSASSVSGQRPSKFKQDVSHTSLKGSSGNLSLGTSLRYTDSITHISLHGDNNGSTASLSNNSTANNRAGFPPSDGDTILVAENVLAIDASALRKIQDNLDLTDAEHYALYMALAPHATVSEFDELSCYYSPVDGGKFPLMAPSNQDSKN